jgi:hypothetical protein
MWRFDLSIIALAARFYCPPPYWNVRDAVLQIPFRRTLRKAEALIKLLQVLLGAILDVGCAP